MASDEQREHSDIPWKAHAISSEEHPEVVAEFNSDLSDSEHIVLVGQCPLCFGRIRTDWPTGFVSPTSDSLSGQSVGGAVEWDVLVECNCGHLHGRSTGHGCGMSMLLRVER